MYILLLFVCLCLFWCLQLLLKKKRLYQLSKNIPGPTPLPFIGSSYIFFFKDASEIANRFMKLFDEYQEVSKLWMGNDLFYLITKPEYLEVILNNPGTLEKIYSYDYTKSIIGDGLISGPVKTWKKHRKIIAPSFNQKILNEYVETVSQQCTILSEIFQKHCGKEIDHCHYITNCALDIVCETILGVPINAQQSTINYSFLFDKLMAIVFIRMFILPYQYDCIFQFTNSHKELDDVITKIKKLSRNIIERKKEFLRNHFSEDKPRNFLDLVIEKYLNNEFTREELEDEVNTLLLAGTDTNATSSSFALTLLGMNQDVQQKLYEELIEVLGFERAVTLDDLPKLKYTERVIKESLRIFPGAPFSGRVIEEDIILNDLIIPKGSNVVIGYLHLHRSEKYWKDPFKFDPDRFLPERSANRHPYTWLPFSGGPRNCIGIKFGMMVMKIMLATIIRKFKVKSSFKSIEDIELTTNIVLKPKNGFRLMFEARN